MDMGHVRPKLFPDLGDASSDRQDTTYVCPTENLSEGKPEYMYPFITRLVRERVAPVGGNHQHLVPARHDPRQQAVE
jgi:hypothetical protein